MIHFPTNKSGFSKTIYKAIPDCATASKILHEATLSRCFRVSVKGYDTSLHPDAIKTALMESFRSCGQIYDVVIPTNFETHTVIDRIGFIFFREEDALVKALSLNGCDVGGRKVIVQTSPKKVCEYRPDEVDSAQSFIQSRRSEFFVTGYDTSLPATDVTSSLFTLFSSCGEIIYITLRKGLGFISMSGEDALEKALRLNGSDMGGWNVVVKRIPAPTTHYSGISHGPPIGYPGPPGHRWEDITAGHGMAQ